MKWRFFSSMLYWCCERRVPMFNKRAMDLLNILLTKDAAVTGNKLAESLQVSNRTIRSDIAQINAQLSMEGIEVKSCNPHGYFIEESDKTLLRMVLEESVESDETHYIPNTPNERLCCILLCLASAKEYVSMNDLADRLYVSKATINQDIKRLIQYMKEKENQVQLQSSSAGIRMIGEELSQRILIGRLFSKQDQSLELMIRLLCFLEPENEKTRGWITGVYHSIISLIELYGHYLSDKEVHSLVLYLVIAARRIKLGYELTWQKEALKIRELTLDIARQSAKILRIGFNKAETLAIQNCLEGKRIVYAPSAKQNDERINQVIDNYLQKVHQIYGLDFRNYENLKRFLYLHIQPMLHRLRRKEEEDNPLKDDIKKKFPLATEISYLLLQEIKEVFSLQMNDSELSYVALHIAAALEVQYTPAKIMLVSDLGASPLQLMKTKLSNHFTNKIDIIGCYTAYQLQSMIQKQQLPACDLIVSTSPLPVWEDIPLVTVSPLMMREDISNIKRYIHYYATEIKDKEKFIDLFDESLFLIVEEKQSYYDVIKRLVALVYEQQIIPDAVYYFDLVVQREQAFSTIMDNRIAIPHAAENIANRTVIATAVLKKPIEHEGRKVSLILLNVLNEKEDLQNMYAAIEKMLQIENVESLLHCKTYQEFISRLAG